MVDLWRLRRRIRDKESDWAFNSKKKEIEKLAEDVKTHIREIPSIDSVTQHLAIDHGYQAIFSPQQEAYRVLIIHADAHCTDEKLKKSKREAIWSTFWAIVASSGWIMYLNHIATHHH